VNEEDGLWVTHMAEGLVCDMLDQFADIRVRRLPETQRNNGVTMDAVCGHIRGDRQMEVRLCAEPGMFYRLTQNIIGDKPQNEDEVHEYAAEFFNVLCGRFISAICDRDHIIMEFNPPQYQKASGTLGAGMELIQHTLSFTTEKEERLEFSWGRHTVEQLMRRSEVQ
jgi:hypothetical protein